MAKERDTRPHDFRMKVVLLWDDDVMEEVELEDPAPVVLGAHPKALFPLPEGAAPHEGVTLLVPTQGGYQLNLLPQVNGALWSRGERRDLRSLASQRSSVDLAPDDYGVAVLGRVSVFFQQVRRPKRMARQPLPLDPTLFASMALSTFLVVSVLAVAYLDLGLRDREDPLELSSDLFAKYMIVPPPEDLFEEMKPAGVELEDPGLRGREETGGERHEDDEGKVGNEKAVRPDTEIAGDVTDRVSARVTHLGLLGALSDGGKGNAIAEALDVPSVSDILGGMGAATTVLGRGSRGAGLRGSGTGGGGDGPGSLFGAGKVGTGLGAGEGVGKGAGGVGAPGRKAKEAQIRVSRGKPRVNGYLSAEQINRVVRAHQAAIKYCYEVQVQRQPNLRGRVEIKWRIDLQGSVTSARVAKSTLGNPRVEGCIVREVRQWRFPEPDGGEVVVNYPFIFGVQGG